MSRMLRVAATVSLSTLALLCLPTAASAETWTATDPAGDVRGIHYDPDPAPCGSSSDLDATTDTNDDIRRIRVTHTQRVVRLKAALTDLDPASNQAVTLYVDTRRHTYTVTVLRIPSNHGKAEVITAVSALPEPPTDDELDECGGWSWMATDRCQPPATVDTDLDTVLVTVPRSCLRMPGWVRAGATTSGSAGWDDPSQQGGDLFWDTWAPAGSTLPDDAWVPPLGPKVFPGPGTVDGDGQNAEPSNRSRVTNSLTGLRLSFVSSLTGLPSGTTAATAY